MQQRVGQPQVAFGILEVYGVHLVRHGRRTDLTGDRALAQVPERDVTPGIAREIDEDGVDAGERVAVLADPVVRLDLRGEFVPGQPLRLDELAAHSRPVDAGQRRDMRVVIADGSIPLGENLDFVEARTRATQPRHHVGEFLAERRGTRGLAVGARQHCELRMLMCEVAQAFDDFFELTCEYGAGCTQHARVGEVVDVFRRAAEMHQFEHGGRGATRGELLAHEVLHGLHIVIDAAFDGFYGRCRVFAGFHREAHGQLFGRFSQRFLEQLGHGFRQRQQPGGFDAHAFADEAAFRQYGAQWVGAFAVPAVDGRKRQKCCGIHERHASNRELDWPRMISQGESDPGRKEHDSFGDIEVPAGALWGAQTERARRNFAKFGGGPLPADFITAVALIKAAAARANARLGLLPADVAKAIQDAVKDIVAGRHQDQFPVDVYQTGSGTSTNMNVNEVIANLASKSLGKQVHPNDHVNMCQSSNDVIPSAIHLSALNKVRTGLYPALEELRRVLRQKEQDWSEVYKTGRTHLMDAMPMTLGQEASGWRAQIDNAIARLKASE